MEADGKSTGIGVFSATFLIAGEMAGSGVLALPKAVVDSDWSGIFLILFFSINSAYGGTRLAKCWEILEERSPNGRLSLRDPYPAIAEEAMGKFGRYLVSVANQIQLLGVGIVFLILASQTVEELLEDVFPNISFCIWIIIFSAVMTPPMWLGSPKDFWFAGIAALLTTSLACICILVQMVLDSSDVPEHRTFKPFDFKDFFIAFGTIMFSYGGAATFPTIQNDMKDRKKFSTSVYIGYALILAIYLPIAIVGAWVYGEKIQDNAILSMSKSRLVVAANCFIAMHLITAFLIIINPASQEIENFLKIPEKFTIKRCVVRTGMVCLMLFVAESIPGFGVILSLLGSSTVALTSFILPNAFYLLLCRQSTDNSPKRIIPWYSRYFMWMIMIVGFLGGVASTYSALVAMFSTRFKKPCYC